MRIRLTRPICGQFTGQPRFRILLIIFVFFPNWHMLSEPQLPGLISFKEELR